jgi:thioredoxin-related protein
MKFRVLFLTLIVSLAGSLQAANEAHPLDPTRDWNRVAMQADGAQLPVLMVVDSPDCSYCKRLEQEVLGPMRRVGALRNKVIMGRMDLRTGGKIVDFDGEKMRARIFLSRYEVFATPTVLFLDPRGRPLREPLVGFNGAAPYRVLLDEAIDDSRTAMAPGTDAGSLVPVAQASWTPR